MTDMHHNDSTDDRPEGRTRGNRAVGTLLLWMIPILIVALVAAFIVIKKKRAVAALTPPQRELPSVAVLRIEYTTYRQNLILPARLDANRTSDLSFELSGRLEKWLIREGEAVKAGQRLAELNTDELQAALSQIKARKETSQRTIHVEEQNVAAAEVALTQAQKDAEALELELQGDQASLKLAGQEFERIKTLFGSNIAVQSDLDTATNALTQAELGVAKARDRIERAKVTVKAARTRVAQAEATLELERYRSQEIDREMASLEVKIAKTVLTAPFAGNLDEYVVEAGEVIAPGQPIGRLYDLAKLRALVDVPDRYIPLMDPGNPMVNKYLQQAMPGAKQDLSAAVTVPGLPKLTGGSYAGVELEATIGRVAQASDLASNTFRVELLIDNPGLALKQGMIVEACINFLAYEDAIIIPLKAVQVTDLGPRVFIAMTKDERTIAEVRNVEPISIQSERILIRGPIDEGDRLIISGWKGLVDGEEIAVVLEDGAIEPGNPAELPATISDQPELIHVPKAPDTSPPNPGGRNK